jgi:uncharacterized protein (DUF2235 family)
MSKKIVFCADGTWNHPQSPAMVSGADTNVYKLYKCLAVTSSQATFYDDGVGSDGLPVDRLLGGAFGAGLFQKIKDGYTSIAHIYEQGDEIFIFGFSRGAYTARSLAGMIAICGLPTLNFDQHMVETAFQAYRNKDQREALLSSLAACKLFDAKITMLGVWDTVGALGIPGALFGASSLIYGFLDTALHPDVLNAYHALAVDERRYEFKPTLWTSQPAQGQIMEQVWFTGVHSDVGGGYAETGLSDITLSWMLQKAIKNGIETIPSAIAKYLNIDPKHSLDQAHESWNILWAFPQRRSIPADATIANSVDIRLAEEAGYRPPNLKTSPSGQLTGYSSEPVVQIPKAAAAAGG